MRVTVGPIKPFYFSNSRNGLVFTSCLIQDYVPRGYLVLAPQGTTCFLIVKSITLRWKSVGYNCLTFSTKLVRTYLHSTFASSGQGIRYGFLIATALLHLIAAEIYLPFSQLGVPEVGIVRLKNVQTCRLLVFISCATFSVVVPPLGSLYCL